MDAEANPENTMDTTTRIATPRNADEIPGDEERAERAAYLAECEAEEDEMRVAERAADDEAVLETDRLVDIAILRDEAARAGDLAQVALCNRALGETVTPEQSDAALAADWDMLDTSPAVARAECDRVIAAAVRA